MGSFLLKTNYVYVPSKADHCTKSQLSLKEEISSFALDQRPTAHYYQRGEARGGTSPLGA